MRVSEVKPGMTGYGVSVFHGTKLERFDVQVVSILRNQMGPNQDIVLIRCKGQGLEHSGAVAGMSGSPIYIKDAQGRERMIGAFALGWEFAKDPIAGVRPIEEMLRVPSEARAVPASAKAAARTTWDARPLLTRLSATPQPSPLRATVGLNALKPLALPISASGVDALFLTRSPALDNGRFMLLQAGSAGDAPADAGDAKLEPGAAIGVPIVSGDFQLSAIGTVTEVIGDRVFAFGHEFNSEGSVNLPMGVGYIHSVIANTSMSFKLGTVLRTDGTVHSDESVAIAGTIGKSPATIPVEITVRTPQRQQSQVYRFQLTRHRNFTPVGMMMAISAAVTGHSRLPEDYSIAYGLKMEFDNGQSVEMKNRTTSMMHAAEIIRDIQMPVQLAIENPFNETYPTRITGSFDVAAEVDAAVIRSATSDKSIYKPGETVRLFLTTRPWRGEDQTAGFELKLPADLPDGPVAITLSDAQRFVGEEMRYAPFKFQADKIEDVFALVRSMTGDRSDQLYIRLTTPGEGVAVGRSSLGKLPTGKRSIFTHDPRPDVIAFPRSIVQKQELKTPLMGSADLQITVARDPHRAPKAAPIPPGMTPGGAPTPPSPGAEPTAPTD
ncbi:MAG: hypothetical protein H7144_18550 [Burkholderiales bacterium]|nr:hypothetical protein [Phycisphaerae bacterium]